MRLRKRVSYETPEYAAMMLRMVRRYGERVGDADPVDLSTMLEVRAAFDQAIKVAVRGQRDAGFSWREIGEGLGTTKQAALMRFRESAEQTPTLEEEWASAGFARLEGRRT